MPRPRKRNIKSRNIKVRVDEALRRRLETESLRTGRSISEIIRRAIREHLKNVPR